VAIAMESPANKMNSGAGKVAISCDHP
jgi:hypothetical protein